MEDVQTLKQLLLVVCLCVCQTFCPPTINVRMTVGKCDGVKSHELLCSMVGPLARSWETVAFRSVLGVWFRLFYIEEGVGPEECLTEIQILLSNDTKQISCIMWLSCRTCFKATLKFKLFPSPHTINGVVQCEKCILNVILFAADTSKMSRRTVNACLVYALL